MNQKKSDFANSLYRVMQTKPFEDISISDLCVGINCTRQNFYYYFKTTKECLAFYIKESMKSRIKDIHLITDTFNLIEADQSLIHLCEQCSETKDVYWQVLASQLKKQMDIILTKKLVDYLSLYSEQKDMVLTFFVYGILEEGKLYAQNGFGDKKEKYIECCKALLGTYDELRNKVKKIIYI